MLLIGNLKQTGDYIMAQSRFLIEQVRGALEIYVKPHFGDVEADFVASRRESNFTDQQVLDIQSIMQTTYELGVREGKTELRKDLNALLKD